MLKSLVLSTGMIFLLAGPAQSGAPMSSMVSTGQSPSIKSVGDLKQQAPSNPGDVIARQKSDGQMRASSVPSGSGESPLSGQSLVDDRSHLDWDSGGPVGPVPVH
ncbi:hypothetical protein [uncultured Roseibium sp.]|uniref:hypothetical protein n=1 Tax=uncultured Roseibium sp. TaxID=1936171 RepID=UPI002602B1E3|nr:hypothetical protein [uncultured Roseibium sp.]